MKLLNDLYEITESRANDQGFSALLKLFPGHIIYTGHFPGQPVTPGVVQLQIVHELLEYHFNRPIRLTTADECKFLKIINPGSHVEISVDYKVNGAEIEARAIGKSEADIFLKLKATYQFI